MLVRSKRVNIHYSIASAPLVMRVRTTKGSHYGLNGKFARTAPSAADRVRTDVSPWTIWTIADVASMSLLGFRVCSISCPGCG